jgi:ATP-dependent exoDNAse (exonuclease V) beta subunit
VLLSEIELQRPGGKPQEDAVNLLSSHSAKGLEWPIVIPVGFWHTISERPQHGLYLVSDAERGGQTRIFFDRASVPTETSEARNRERLREQVRLLYVTLTRARSRLIIPWHAEFGSRRGSDKSFAEIWSKIELLEALPQVNSVATDAPEEDEPQINAAAQNQMIQPSPTMIEEGRKLAPLPRRLLPHQLAQKTDLVRGQRHETSLDHSTPSRLTAGDEAIDYGIWWHETMEFTPWRGSDAAVEKFWQARLSEAQSRGYGTRAKTEWMRLRASPAWNELRSEHWTLVTELAVFSPLVADSWIDGVMDISLHDAETKRLWIIDWKTNRLRVGEDNPSLLVRLSQEYAPQLAAYGQCLQQAMFGHEVRLLVYASAAGDWIEVTEQC